MLLSDSHIHTMFSSDSEENPVMLLTMLFHWDLNTSVLPTIMTLMLL